MAVARALAVAGLLLLVTACHGPRPRVLLVGLGGASPRVIEPMLRAGRLPNLARLAHDGSWGWTKSSFRPMLSTVIWTTAATGKGPELHGIRGFMRAARGQPRLYESRDRKAHALWNILSLRGLRVGVVNWPATFPSEIVEGVVVSEQAIPAAMAELAGGPPPSHATAYPVAWVDRTRAVVAGGPTPDLPPDPFAAPSELPERSIFDRLSGYYARDAATLELALGVEEEIDPDALLVLFFGIDRVSHHLWRYVEPDQTYTAEMRPRPEDVAAGRALVEEYYRVVDFFLGRLLERYDLRRDLAIVLSDHGFEASTAGDPFLSGSHISPRAEVAVIFVCGAGVASGGRFDGARPRDVTPTILTWLGLPVGRDMEGKPLAEFFPESRRFRSPPEPVATHDVGRIRRVRGEPPASPTPLENELRILGYVE